MRRSAAFTTVVGIMVLSLGFAAPARAAETLPPGASNTARDFRQGVPSSALENVFNDPDQKGYDAKFAEQTKYYGPGSTATGLKEKFGPAMTGAKKLGVGAGNTFMAVMGVQLVVQATSGVFGAVAGIDDINGQVCKKSGDGKWVSELFGYDCNDTGVSAGFAPNSDLQAQYQQLDPWNFPIDAKDPSLGNDAVSKWQGANASLQLIGVVGGAALPEWGYPAGYVYYQPCFHASIGSNQNPTVTPAEESAGRTTMIGRADFTFDGIPALANTWINIQNGASANNKACAASGGNAAGGVVVQPGPAKSVGVKTFGLRGGQVINTAVVLPDPDRYIRCTVTMTDGTSVSADSPKFKESSGKFAAPACPSAPAGKTAATVSFTEEGQGIPSRSLGVQQVTPGYTNWKQKFPQCGDGTCLLDLVKTTPSPSVSCFDLEDTCNGWVTDPAKADNYACTYGGQAVELAECNIYGSVFNPQARQQGTAYADPKTGNPVSPADPTTVPADANVYNRSVNPQAEGRRCFPTGWDVANPVQWVLMPAQCALEWAFVPDAVKTQASMKKASDAWAGTPPAKMTHVIELWGGMFPSLDGCQGPKVSFHFYDMGGDFYPLDACKAPLDTVAATGRVIGAVGMYFAACLAITRYLGATFGYTGLGSGNKE